MRRMLFQEPIFHPGLNLTVRRGPKWSDLVPGEGIELGAEDPGDSLLSISAGVATVTFVWTGRARDIPDYWLRFEHSPKCRNRRGLKAVMDAIYRTWEEECTLVFFWY